MSDAEDVPTGEYDLGEQSGGEADEEQIIATPNIDWRELFEEFGMHTPNAARELHVSSFKLAVAIEASEQNIVGDPHEHIRAATESASLIEETVSGHQGGDVTAGYRLGGDFA